MLRLNKQLHRNVPRQAFRSITSGNSWVPEDADNTLLQEYTVKALTYEMEQYQRKSAEQTVPWFLKNFPKQYFQEISRDLQRDHLRALTALSESALHTGNIEDSMILCEAAAKGDIERVRYLVSLGCNPNKGDYDDRTAIHLAAAEGQMEVLRFLASIPGVNLNCRDRWGTTPIKDAQIHGQEEAVAFLKEESEKTPVDVSAQTMKQSTGVNDLMLKSRNQRFVSFFNSDFSPSQFRSSVSQLNFDRPIKRTKAFKTLDETLGVSVFEYGAPDFPSREFLKSQRANDIIKYGLENGLISDRESMEEWMLNSPLAYLEKSLIDKIYIHKKMLEQSATPQHAERTLCRMSSSDSEPNKYWFYCVSTNVAVHSEMVRYQNYLGAEGFKVDRLHVDQFDKTDGNRVLTRVLVEAPSGVDMNPERMAMYEREMERLKFLDDSVLLNYEADREDLTLRQCEVLGHLGNMIFCPLNKNYPFAFTLDRLLDTVFMHEHAPLSHSIASLFECRFDLENPLQGDAYQAEVNRIDELITESVQTVVWQKLFYKMLDAVSMVYRTNLYVPSRMSLTSRIDPEIMFADSEGERERPYGVFFLSGRRFNAFHCRFREISRGGLRVVNSGSGEAFSLESTRHFDEVYGLSSAQQLKNKDIPEGGSKAVLLVNTKHQAKGATDKIDRACVKYFGDGILDLITPDPAIRAKTLDYWGKPELLYLGPDENIIPDDIKWLIDRAAIRGMQYPDAFMSSKSDNGINHKEFGVTSEGVAVFLEVALMENGINPYEQEFTIKITGGPNGDVAGNMLKILNRDYGSNAKVVGISDGTGCVENEQGLDMNELLRLFYADLPLASYQPRDDDRFHLVDTPEGIQKRNTMHNRMKADVFVPGGGRPNTINLMNWKHFMNEDGTPSSPLIVEAANIFTTPEARKQLGNNGVMIVKDSSANKAGVCCSSYEIVSSMLLSKEEFMANKKEVVDDVLVRLRDIARQEALQLFREAKLNPEVQMPQVAAQISVSIQRAHDLFSDILEKNPGMLSDDTKNRLIRESLPNKLVELAGDRLLDLPQPYIRAMLSAALSSRMVYGEGTQFIDELSDDQLRRLAGEYLETADQVRDCIASLKNSDIKGKETIIDVLQRFGIRSKASL